MDAKVLASFFLVLPDEIISQLQKSMKLLKKNLKGLKHKVCGSYGITQIRIPSSENLKCFKHQRAETAQYRLEIIFNIISSISSQ